MPKWITVVLVTVVAAGVAGAINYLLERLLWPDDMDATTLAGLVLGGVASVLAIIAIAHVLDRHDAV